MTNPRERERESAFWNLKQWQLVVWLRNFSHFSSLYKVFCTHLALVYAILVPVVGSIAQT